MSKLPLSGENWKTGLQKRLLLLMGSVNASINERRHISFNAFYGDEADAMIEQNMSVIRHLKDEGITDFNVELACGQMCECVVICELDEEYRVVARKILKSYRGGDYERDGFGDVDRELKKEGKISFTV